jgi:HdeA/HdeB family
MSTHLLMTASALAMAGPLANGSSLRPDRERLAGRRLRGAAAATGQAAGQGGGMDAAEITCREIVAMDTATVPGVLYFISGYRAGQQDAMQPGAIQQGGMQQGGMQQGGGAASADAGAAGGDGQTVGAGGAATDTAAAGSPSVGEGSDAMRQANEAAAGNTAGAVTDMGGADAAGRPMQNQGTAASAIGQEGGGMAGGGGQVQVSRVAGYFEIPVEQTIVACQQSMDQRASDVIEQQRGQAGGGTPNRRIPRGARRPVNFGGPFPVPVKGRSGSPGSR